MVSRLASLLASLVVMGAPTPRAAPEARELTALPRSIPLEGKRHAAWRFTDREGAKVITFSRSDKPGAAYLYASLWRLEKGRERATRLRRLVDFRKDCEFDLVADFQDAAFAVTDLDGDGVGEVTFAYELACTSDVSPNTLKLVLLEGRDKYIVRGSTRVVMGDAVLGGEREEGASLAKGPPKFKAHLAAVWARIVERRM